MLFLLLSSSLLPCGALRKALNQPLQPSSSLISAASQQASAAHAAPTPTAPRKHKKYLDHPADDSAWTAEEAQPGETKIGPENWDYVPKTMTRVDDKAVKALTAGEWLEIDQNSEQVQAAFVNFAYATSKAAPEVDSTGEVQLDSGANPSTSPPCTYHAAQAVACGWCYAATSMFSTTDQYWCPHLVARYQAQVGEGKPYGENSWVSVFDVRDKSCFVNGYKSTFGGHFSSDLDPNGPHTLASLFAEKTKVVKLHKKDLDSSHRLYAERIQYGMEGEKITVDPSWEFADTGEGLARGYGRMIETVPTGQGFSSGTKMRCDQYKFRVVSSTPPGISPRSAGSRVGLSLVAMCSAVLLSLLS